MKVSYMAHVSGKVQGIYFRVSSQQVAIEYGVSGYARNLTNGDVEVLMCGEEQNIKKMINWLELGPTEAEVSNVEVQKVPWQEHHFFSVN